MRHILSGLIKGDKKIYQLNVRLLREVAVVSRPLANCCNVEVEPIGAPSVAVLGGYHWSVC